MMQKFNYSFLWKNVKTRRIYVLRCFGKLQKAWIFLYIVAKNDDYARYRMIKFFFFTLLHDL